MRISYLVGAAVLTCTAAWNAGIGWSLPSTLFEEALGHYLGSLVLLAGGGMLVWRGLAPLELQPRTDAVDAPQPTGNVPLH